MFSLKDKVALITGGAKGIGKAVAETFHKAGAKIVIWDLDEEGQKTADSLNGKFYKVNTADREGLEKATQQVISDFGRIDILVNNAGILRDSSFLKMTDNLWDDVINVNLTGVYNCAKAVVPHMKAQKQGRIINASSIAGVYGNFGQTNYSAAKAGVIGFTKSLAREVGKDGITVNAIAPGYIQTEMTASIPQEFQEKIIASIPVRRAGKPEDVANAYLYLASEEASFVNGSVLHVDGGGIL
ncbi:3-oxoacyl-[acyl-carrier-protein] reductase (plasmid) [Bernardetia sp. Wsw4-3y2]|uniref:3-oxoacyl-[acyl-carrier-protein] reductase n=1 Tax=Bernardetia sp. Wsw4-3y2 TaxID=3127471 RepID=UPI0030CCF9D6